MAKGILILTLLLLSLSASAHIGLPIENSFMLGIMHPLSGLDHLLVMLTAGLWISYLPAGISWKIALSFIISMVMSAFLALALGPLPGVELTITLSVILLGLVLFTCLRLQTALTALLLLICGAFHGYAHGVESPSGGVTSYIIGFSLMSLLLIAVGLLLGNLIAKTALNRWFMRFVGALIVIFSVSWLVV